MTRFVAALARRVCAPTMLRINVGGQVHSLTKGNIRRAPGLLARALLDDSPYACADGLDGAGGGLDGVTGEHLPYFDRDGRAFGAVIAYLRTGLAMAVPDSTYVEQQAELAYFFDTPAPPLWTEPMRRLADDVRYHYLLQCVHTFIGCALKRPIDTEYRSRVMCSKRIFEARFTRGEFELTLMSVRASTTPITEDGMRVRALLAVAAALTLERLLAADVGPRVHVRVLPNEIFMWFSDDALQ